jgi:polysaccharide deacetylase family protein (PEP-CTERM system associated)
MLNAFTVDVEDYFHPSEVGSDMGPNTWSTLPSRVEMGTSSLLDLLASHGVRATFFILGWVASEKPALVRRIAEAGHEIACHSNEHRLIYELSPSEFKADTLAAIRAIKDACGITPRTYRAPSFSITGRSLWALEILAECGFTHDSSICPIVHDRYGIPGSPRHAHTIETPSGSLTEVPVATVQLSNSRVAPVGGGGYLRLFPYRYTAAGLRRINTDEGKPACVYVHPWELDTNQPRLAKGHIARLRTYMGLATVGHKLNRLLQDFQFATLREVYPSPNSAKQITPVIRYGTPQPMAVSA